MLNIVLFVIGLAVLAYALGWRVSWDAVKAAASGAWRGTVALFTTAPLYERGAAIIGVLFLVFAFFGGPVSGGTLSPRDALDKAIRDFQAYAGLTVDGVFGPATVKAYYGKR